MSTQLHKNYTDGQVKSLFEKYSKKEIKLNYILQILRIKRSRFFELLAKYRKDPNNFSIQHGRKRLKINREIKYRSLIFTICLLSLYLVQCF